MQMMRENVCIVQYRKILCWSAYTSSVYFSATVASTSRTYRLGVLASVKFLTSEICLDSCALSTGRAALCGNPTG